MRACNRIYQLPCDANFPRRLPHRPLEDIAHAEPAPDFLDIDGFALEGETRVTCDNEQRLKARQRSDDFFHHALGEKFLLGIAAHVLKRQHGDGGFVGERKVGFLKFYLVVGSCCACRFLRFPDCSDETEALAR